jgi:hypothetical protein
MNRGDLYFKRALLLAAEDAVGGPLFARFDFSLTEDA